MALVIFDGFQYDDRNLPKHVDPARCVPADEWFAKHKVTGRQKRSPIMTADLPLDAGGDSPVPSDDTDAGDVDESTLSDKPAASPRRRRGSKG